MLNVPRFDSSEIEKSLKPGDRVEWYGQPCTVLYIDVSKPEPVLLKNQLTGRSERASFNEITDMRSCGVVAAVLGQIRSVGHRVLDVLRKDI